MRRDYLRAKRSRIFGASLYPRISVCEAINARLVRRSWPMVLRNQVLSLLKLEKARSGEAVDTGWVANMTSIIFMMGNAFLSHF